MQLSKNLALQLIGVLLSIDEGDYQNTWDATLWCIVIHRQRRGGGIKALGPASLWCIVIYRRCSCRSILHCKLIGVLLSIDKKGFSKYWTLQHFGVLLSIDDGVAKVPATATL